MNLFISKATCYFYIFKILDETFCQLLATNYPDIEDMYKRPFPTNQEFGGLGYKPLALSNVPLYVSRFKYVHNELVELLKGEAVNG